MRRLLAVSVLAIMTAPLVAASAAGARTPDRMFQTFDGLEVTDDTTCPFPFEERVDGHIIRTTFYDNDGNVTRAHVNVFGLIEITNPATGKTLKGIQSNLYDIPDPSTRVTSGLRFMAHVPGGGVVILDAGRVVTVDGDIVFEAGPHQFVNGDVQEFCGYLGSP